MKVSSAEAMVREVRLGAKVYTPRLNFTRKGTRQRACSQREPQVPVTVAFRPCDGRDELLWLATRTTSAVPSIKLLLRSSCCLSRHQPHDIPLQLSRSAKLFDTFPIPLYYLPHSTQASAATMMTTGMIGEGGTASAIQHLEAHTRHRWHPR
jgi:hypothetical protein